MRKLLEWGGIIITAAMTLLWVALYAQFSDKVLLLQTFEQKTLDLRFKLRGERQPNPDVAIVLVDDKSLNAVGRWPWPRVHLANMVDHLHSCGAKAIGFDMLFPESESSAVFLKINQLRQLYQHYDLGSTKKGKEFAQAMVDAIEESDHDRLFTNAIKSSGNVVLPIAFYISVEGQEQAVDENASASTPAPAPPDPNSDEPPADLLAKMGTADNDPMALMPQSFKNAAVDGITQKDASSGFKMLGASDVLLPVEDLAESAWDLGYVNFFHSEDGGLRWETMAIEFAGRHYVPISVNLARQYRGLTEQEISVVPGQGLLVGSTLVPLDERGRMLINYYGPAGKIHTYSFVDIMDGNVPPDAFKNKVVLIGGSATGIGDYVLTPFATAFPGVEKHATVISNILNGEFLRQNSFTKKTDMALILFTGLLLGAMLTYLHTPPKRVAFAMIMVLTVAALGAVAFQYYGLWLNIVYPILNLSMITVFVLPYQHFMVEREKRQIKGAFKRYLSDALVERLSEHPDMLKLGGVKKSLTVMFSDIRNFTNMSEAMQPEELVSVLNTYLTSMTRIVMANSGIVDKYIGDAIMAVFGAPVDNPKHAHNCCVTALEMMRELERLRPEWKEHGFPNIAIGIGINTGPMIVGNMGSEERFDYTVIGDNVNLSSRLEGLCKLYGCGIVVSEFTRQDAPEFTYRELDLVRVKGKEHAITIYELICQGEPQDEAIKLELSEHNRALELYRAMQWEDAAAVFKTLHEKHPRHVYEIYIERAAQLSLEPPGPQWDGVFTLYRK